MICLIALVVFSILGIFSVKYRQLSAKAFDCVFRRLTLRPCQSGLDHQVKTGIISFFSKKNVNIARFVAKYFEALSWFFTILMILSIVFSIQGFYFYMLYGNCNGAGSDAFCVFDALNPGEKTSTCSDPSMISNTTVTERPTIGNSPSIGPKDAKVTIIEFGCFSCPYTKKVEPVVQDILKNYGDKVLFVYRDFPLPNHPASKERALAAECANEQDKYWEYHKLLFDKQEEALDNNTLFEMAATLGMDRDKFQTCFETQKYIADVEKDFEDGKKAGIYGTPTFFINDKTVVGPKPYPYFKNIIDAELKK